MANQLRLALEEERRKYIRKLLSEEIYRPSDHRLYELTLGELEMEYQSLIKEKNKTYGSPQNDGINEEQ